MTVASVEKLISGLLRTGVIVSLIVVVTGAVLTFVQQPALLSSAGDLSSLLSPKMIAPLSLGTVMQGVLTGQGLSLVLLGLMLLIATPVLRVGVSIFIFVLQRDWVFVAITTIVLTALICSFWVGKME